MPALHLPPIPWWSCCPWIFRWFCLLRIWGFSNAESIIHILIQSFGWILDSARFPRACNTARNSDMDEPIGSFNLLIHVTVKFEVRIWVHFQFINCLFPVVRPGIVFTWVLWLYFLPRSRSIEVNSAVTSNATIALSPSRVTSFSLPNNWWALATE